LHEGKHKIQKIAVQLKKLKKKAPLIRAGLFVFVQDETGLIIRL